MADPIPTPIAAGLRRQIHPEQVTTIDAAICNAIEALEQKLHALANSAIEKAIDFQLLKIDMVEADQILLFKFKGPLPRDLERQIDAYLERKLRGTGIVHMIVGDGYPEAPQLETIASVVITKPKDDGN